MYCHTCKRYLHPLGMARHRSMHKDKKENCEIEYSDGRIRCFKFSELQTTLKTAGVQ